MNVIAERIPGVEYVVIDGGSGAATLGILEKYQNDIDNKLSEPDFGIAEAFNKGILAAKGQLIGFLNAGDRYEQNALRFVAKAYNSHPDVDIFCGSIQFWESGSPTLLCHSNLDRIEQETSVYHPTVFIKRSAYLRYGQYDEEYRYAMDYELLLRFKRNGAKFFNLEETLANMPLDGISHKHWYEGLKEVGRARSKYFSPANVAYHHLRAVAMNLAARGLKSVGLRGVYQAYWNSRNEKTSADRRQGV